MIKSRGGAFPPPSISSRMLVGGVSMFCSLIGTPISLGGKNWRRWGIRYADRVVAEVFDAVTSWKEVFASAGVTAKDIMKFANIDDHLHS